MDVMESLLPLGVLLTGESPRHADIDHGRIKLRPHQAAAVARCREIEAGRFRYDAIKLLCLDIRFSDMTTRVAAICDRPGTGKSHIVLALCATNDTEPREATSRIAHHNVLSFSMTFKELRCTSTNIIVVPHSLMSQWVSYICDAGMMNETFVFGRKSIHAEDTLMTQISSGSVRIVLCSNNNYSKVFQIVQASNVQVRRLFIDEADSIALGKTELLSAGMYWMVTSSVENLLMPSPPTMDWGERYSKVVSHGVRTKCISDVMDYLCYQATLLRALLFVRSCNAFLDESMDVQASTTGYVLCSSPACCDDIINKGDPSKVAASLTRTWTERLQILEISIRRLGKNPNILSKDEYDMLKSQMRLAESHRVWLSTVHEKVVAPALCPICYAEPTNRCVMQCCTATFCFNCVAQWISKHRNCPACRKYSSKEMLHVVVSPPSSLTADRIMTKNESAVMLANSILNRSPSARILMFCANMNVFATLHEDLRSHGMAIMKGNGSAIQNTVSKFENGTFRIMCVSNDCFCSGINLSVVTDVIIFHHLDHRSKDMIVGRAQRLGRVGGLRVWQLVHKHDDGDDSAVGVASILASTTT